MNVLTHISLNFQQPNYLTVYAAQNDRLSRYINAQLLDGSAPWTLPTGGLMTIRYRKPDGTSGFYDTLEDGSPAYNVETDGSITFGLAEQALTVPGAVPVELNFYNAAGSKLSTLTFIVAVKPSAYSDEDIASSDYYNILTAKMQQLAELSDQAEGDYQDYLSALSAFVGAPRTAPTAADMLDTNLVYVYTGSETGYTYGDWYYYNGREWTSGGVYNSAAISLDATLTNADKPAQAKAAGDLVLVQDTQPTAPVNKLWFPLTDPEDEQVPTWDEFSDLKSSTSQLEDNALIIVETDKAFDHEQLTTPQAITFYGNELAFDTAHYADKPNLVPEGTLSLVSDGVTMTRSFGNFIVYNGTASRTTNFTFYSGTATLPAGSYKLIAEMSAATTATGNCRFIVRVRYSGDASYTEIYNQWKGASFDTDIVLDRDAEYIWIYYGIVSGFVYDNYRLWVGLYQGNVNITDTAETVAASGTYRFTASTLAELTVIDTMQHESAVEYIAPSKEYINTHIPDIIGFWNDHIYALPEDFGAVGDGIADDSAAIAACLAYAKTSGKAVRGFGAYKTTETTVIDGRDMDVFLHVINYTGAGNAVELSAIGIVFGFHKISSGGIGIAFIRTETTSPFRCQVTGNEITSISHCIDIWDRTYYNTVDVRYLSSSEGNCINQETVPVGTSSGEYVFRSATCHCPNGWVASNLESSKFYDFTIEGDCQYGFLNPAHCACIGCRNTEQTDGMKYRVFGDGPIRNCGPFVKFDKLNTGMWRFLYDSSDNMSWFNIDTSAVSGYSEVPDSGMGSLDNWQKLSYSGNGTEIAIRGANGQSRKFIGNKFFIIGGNLVLEPPGRTTSVIDIATVDFRLFDSRVDADIVAANPLCKYLGTDYIINTPATIYFNAYFGAIGYNDLTVTQQNGNTAVIYDKLGNVLFDGTNLGDGKWRLQCIMDRSSFGRYQGTTEWWLYDGTNEIWEITKIT